MTAMRMGIEPEEKTPEVATTQRTRSMFNFMMLVESLLLLPRFIIGLFR